MANIFEKEISSLKSIIMQKVITVEHIQKTGQASAVEQRVTEYPPVVKLLSEGWKATAVTSTSSHLAAVTYITIILEKH